MSYFSRQSLPQEVSDPITRSNLGANATAAEGFRETAISPIREQQSLQKYFIGKVISLSARNACL
jgi:hypothetical protein